MKDGALEDFHHVIDLGGMGTAHESGSTGSQFHHGIDGAVDRSGGIRLGFESDRRGGRRLLLGQSIDKVVHDDIGQVDVLARGVVEMVSADGIAITVAAEGKNMEIWPGKTDSRSERQSASMDEMDAMTVHKVGEPGTATDAGDGDNLFVGDLEFFQNFVEGGENGKIAATRTPGRMVSGQLLLGEFFGFRVGGCCYTHVGRAGEIGTGKGF